MRAAAVVCGAVLALTVAPLAFGHGTNPDEHGLGPWVDVGRPVPPRQAPGRELTTLRTARSRTFQRANGTRVIRVYQQSQFFRANGRWARIDNRLQAANGRYTNAGNRFDVSIPKRLADAPLRVTNGSRSLSFRLLGAADVAAAVAGADATFRDVLPGVTARWSAENDSVKEDLVLKRRDVARVFRYDVAGSAGLAVRHRTDGGLEFVDGAGRGAFVIPGGVGFDAKGLQSPPSAVTMTAKPGGSGWIVELRVKDSWLDDADTTFPVTVDPTVEVPSQAADCKLDGELTHQSFCNSGLLEVGWSSYGAFEHDHRAVLRFDVDAAVPPGATITSASLNAYADFAEPGADGKPIEVHRVTSPWTDDATWFDSASGIAWGAPGGDFAAPIEAQTTIGDTDTWYQWSITNLVKGWYDRTIPNQGLLLKDDGTQTDGSVTFSSTETGESSWPFLQLEYTGGAPAGPANELTGGLRTPLASDRTLTARATDDDGVKSVGIWLDPDLDPTPSEAVELVTDPCATACPDELTANYTLPDVAEGPHTLLVRSDDGAGGVTRDRWTIHVASLGDADRSRLGLEQWFQYDATDTGGDSNLYVNADTGNVIWHSVPIVNRGRGLSTVVNLTYNSMDDGGLLRSALGHEPVFAGGAGALDADRLAPLSYAPVGNGFSISVSGPTRVNEPLRGVILAAAAEEGLPLEGVTVPASAAGLKIRMTDADGTEHTFTNVAGKWVAPPGLNMHLRRYKPGGSIADPIPDKWALTRPDGITHFFDNLGFLTRTEDRNGNALTYNYERVNAFDGAACAADDVIGRLYPGAEPRLCTRRLTSVTDPAGRNLTITYEDGGFLDAPAAGMLPQLPLDQAGPIGGSARISYITDQAGRRYEFWYDDNGYMTRFEEANNRADKRITGFTYEARQNRLGDVGDDRFMDSIQEWANDPDATNPIATTELWYDDRGVLAPGADRQQRRPFHIRTRSWGEKNLDFDTDAHRLDVTQLLEFPSGRTATTTHELDERGRPVRVTDALGTISQLDWSDDNKVTRMTRALGTSDESATDYTYDETNGTGVLESQTSYPSWPDTTGARTTDLVWAFGSGLHHSTAAGVDDTTGTFVADLDQLQNPKPGTGWDFTFDSRGNVTDRADAAGHTAHTGYDSFGRIISEKDENPGIDPVTYGDFQPTGDPGTVTDERGKTWTYKYDTVGNVTAVIDPRAGTQTSGAEGNPYTTNLSYDSFDRLTREHIPKLSNPADDLETGDSRFVTRTYTYDRNGNVVDSVDGLGRHTRLEYTEMDMPAKVTAPGSTGTEVTQYVYDAADRLIGTIAPKGNNLTTPDDVVDTHAEECSGEDPPLDFLTRYCLDDIGRLQAEIRYSTRSGDPTNLTTTFAYDHRDNLTGMVDPNRNQGRLAGVAITAASTPSLQRMAYGYDKVDEQVTGTEKPTEAGASPTVWSYVYDPNGNQIEIHHPRGDAIRTHLTYDHRDELVSVEDPLGHLTCLQRRADERVIAETTPRGTDGNHAACFNGTGYTHYTTKYTYDPTGNVSSRSIPFAPNQYGRTDADFADWKVQYTRNDVGDPIKIKDARGHEFANTFYDSGELRTTGRPSFFAIQGGAAVERTGGSSNAARSTEQPEHQLTLGQTDFGRVDPEALPDLLPQAGPTKLVYDNEMRLTTVRNAAGDERTLEYDPAGRVKVQTWPFKANDPISNTLAHDKNGNVTSFTDGRGKQTTYAYDGYDRLIRTTAPGAGADPSTTDDASAPSQVTRFRYDANDNQRFRETPRGVATGTANDFTFETGFDSLDRVAFDKAPDGGTTSYAYDVASNLIAETRPRGQGRTGEDLESFQTRMTYDNADRLIESRQQVTDGADLVELPTTLSYDADDNLVRIVEPGAKGAPDASLADRVTARVFDGRGMPWKTTVGAVAASERTSIVEFDPNGNLRRIVNPRGVNQDTENARVVDSGADTNANNSAASENATVLRYNDDDLLVSERLPWNSGDERKFRRVFQRTDDDPDTVDSLGRVTSILSPHVIDDEGDPVADNVARVSYSYYDNDWIRSISDQKLTDPTTDKAIEHRLIFLDYDKAGNQIDWESKNFGESSAGRHMARVYWPNGLLKTRTAEKKVDPSEDAKTRSYQYFYDRNNALAAMKDLRTAGNAADDRLTTVTRDPVERQLDVNETWANGKDSRFAYDIAGNVLTRRTDGKIQSDGSFGGSDAKSTTFDYDSLDREFRMTVDPATGSNRVTTTNYWPSGRRELRRKPNNATDRWFYNTRNEITRRERQKDGAALDDADVTNYGYDDNGNRDRDERGTYDFNARDQLIKWTKSSGKVTEYQLNGDGAITQKSVSPTPGAAPTVTTFTYRGERLKYADTGNTRQYYRYDDFGNVARILAKPRGADGNFPAVDETASQSSECPNVPNDVGVDEIYYCYDEFERPRLTKGGGSGSETEVIDYDGLDRRDTRKVGTTKTRDFSYIGLSELLSRDVDEDGKTRSYDYDSQGDRVGQQVTSGSTSRYRSYVKDANGSVLALEDDNGDIDRGGADNKSAVYDYDPYGNLENAGDLNGEADDNPFRFEGFYYDSGVQTYDMLARAYRPDVGRFLTQDRYASASQDLLLQADALTQNRYAFGGANPVNNVEFDGHDPSSSYTNGCDPLYGSDDRCKKESKAAQEQSAKDQVTYNYAYSDNWRAGRLSSPSSDKRHAYSVAKYQNWVAGQEKVRAKFLSTDPGKRDPSMLLDGGAPASPRPYFDKLNKPMPWWFELMLMCAGPGKWGCGKEAFAGVAEGGRAIIGQLRRLGGKTPKEAPIVPPRGGPVGAEEQAGRHGDDVGGTLGRACGLRSFGARTLVTMADGSKKPISRIKVGDRVLATNPLSGTQSARRVTHVWVHEDSVIRLDVGGEVLVTTEDHPFWNATDRAWERADSVDRGDRIGTANRAVARYRGLVGRFWRTSAYNLTVDAVHTYHVGRRGLLVHNAGCTNITQEGLEHSFDRHAAQWFGGQPTKAAQMGQWRSVIERTAASKKVVPWSSGTRLTNAHLARIDGKYFAAQFDRSTGDLVTAFVPNQQQLGAMLRSLRP
jgi:RHS repeat-associated protein